MPKKGFVMPQATRDKIALARTGLKQSEESKRKNSETNIATWKRKKEQAKKEGKDMPSGIYKRTEKRFHTQETKDKMSRSHKGKKHTQEHIAKRAAACMLTWQRKREAIRLEDQEQAATSLQDRS